MSVQDPREPQTQGPPSWATRLAPRALPWALGAALALWTVLAFLPALTADFVRWDDPALLLDNARYRALAPDNLRWMFTTTLMGHYQPLTWLSYALDYLLWGLRPAGFHLTSILLHAAAGVLVYLLGVRLFAAAKRTEPRAATVRIHAAAALGAALWAVHPLRAESVAWVTERRDVLSGLFLLLTALAYTAAVPRGSPTLRSRTRYLASIALLACSLLSKAWGMSFFVLALALDIYPYRRLPPSPRAWFSKSVLRILLEKAPYAALGIAAALMAARAQRSAFAPKTLAEWSVLDRALQAIYGLAFYVEKTVWPSGLSPLHELPPHLSPTEPRLIIACIIVGAAAILAWTFRKKAPALPAAAAAYAVLLLPVLGIAQSGDQLVADRYSYLACIGLSLCVGAGAAGLAFGSSSTPARLRATGAATAAVLLTLGVLTFNQAGAWNDTESLWKSAMDSTPTPTVRINYALELARQGRDDEAAAQLSTALESRPTDGRAWFVLGNLARKAGHYPEAERALKNAAQHMPQAYMARVNLGSLYLTSLNRPREALDMFREAVADVERGGQRPISGMPYLALGDALRRTGDPEGARAAFQRALDFPETRAQAEKELRALDASTK